MINLNSYFSHQQQLNKYLSIDPSLNNYKITARKLLALQVKISDLANETKCFIYWKEKDMKISKQVVLEKYVDCLGHVLTAGLDRGYEKLQSISIKPNDYCLSDQFLNLLIDINDLIISPSLDHYETLVEDFISLGISLGLSMDLVEEKFLKVKICKIAL